KFSGLPGLIIKIFDEKKHWNFELVSLSPENKTVPYGDDNCMYTNISKDKFYAERIRCRDNAFEIEMATGRNDNLSEAAVLKIKTVYGKMAKSDNNWIELYP